LEKDPIMFRSAAVTLLFIILPSLALAQEVAEAQQSTHEVVKGETLWSLAERYLGNPYRWPLIYEANASQIQNPNILEPGQVLVIPGVGMEVARVQGVMVITQAEAAPSEEEFVTPPSGVWVEAAGGEEPPCPGPGDRTLFFSGRGQTRSCPPIGPPTGQRSSFYPQSDETADLERRVAGAGSGGSVSSAAVSTAAVPLGLVYSSDWLVRREEEIGFIGTLVWFSRVHVERTPRGPARLGERLQIATEEGTRLRVGDLLQSFRPLREDRGFGTIIRPTGILAVIAVSETGVIATVSSEFGRIQLEDRVRLVPDYTPRPNVFPLPVESNVTATILGFPEERQVQLYGASAFLDVGEAEGISIGDIFLAQVDEPGPLFGMEAARLQIVLVDGTRSTARIIGMRHSVLGSGDRLRLIQKMQ
jgi:LysM repeat protein